MANNIKISVDVNQLTADYPTGGSIPAADDNKYFSYSVDSWDTTPSATAEKVNNIWEITVPGTEHFSWFAAPEGQPITDTSIKLTQLRAADLNGGALGPASNQIQCNANAYDKTDPSKDVAGCTIGIEYNNYSYTWDPKVLIGGGSN